MQRSGREREMKVEEWSRDISTWKYMQWGATNAVVVRFLIFKCSCLFLDPTIEN